MAVVPAEVESQLEVSVPAQECKLASSTPFPEKRGCFKGPQLVLQPLTQAALGLQETSVVPLHASLANLQIWIGDVELYPSTIETRSNPRGHPCLGGVWTTKVCLREIPSSSQAPWIHLLIPRVQGVPFHSVKTSQLLPQAFLSCWTVTSLLQAAYSPILCMSVQK